MNINLNEMIICPIKRFIQLAKQMGLTESQITELTNTLISSDTPESLDIKEFYQQKLNIIESRKIKKECNWKTGADSSGSRAF